MAKGYNSSIKIECIKGFIPEGGDLVIMKGDRFYQLPGNEDDWIGEVDGRLEHMSIFFYKEQLAENFQFVGRKITL